MSIEALEQGLLNDQNNSEEAAVRHVLTYFSKGGNLTQKTADGRTPLMLAIRYSYNSSINAYNIEVIKYVLNKKPDISAKDNDGESVLFYAINWSCQEVVGILIKSGCDPNEKGQNGITPLMKAVQINADLEIVDILLANNADIYAQNKSGSTALHEAAGMGRLEILQHLKPKIRDFELRNKIDGTTLLICAAMHDDHRVLEFLLNNGAKVDIADNEKRTPLMWAVHSDRHRNAEILIKRGANVNLKNMESKTAIDMVMEKSDEKERNNFMRFFKPQTFKSNQSSEIVKFFKPSMSTTSIQSTNSSKRSSSSLPFHQETHLRMTQELKYVGNQFIVGKTDPKLQSTHELRFQRLYSARLRKLYINKSREQRPVTITELKEIHNSLAVTKRIK